MPLQSWKIFGSYKCFHLETPTFQHHRVSPRALSAVVHSPYNLPLSTLTVQQSSASAGTPWTSLISHKRVHSSRRLLESQHIRHETYYVFKPAALFLDGFSVTCKFASIFLNTSYFKSWRQEFC